MKTYALLYLYDRNKDAVQVLDMGSFRPSSSNGMMARVGTYVLSTVRVFTWTHPEADYLVDAYAAYGAEDPKLEAAARAKWPEIVPSLIPSALSVRAAFEEATKNSQPPPATHTFHSKSRTLVVRSKLLVAAEVHRGPSGAVTRFTLDVCGATTSTFTLPGDFEAEARDVMEESVKT